MSLILWACHLVQGRGDEWMPRVVQVLDGIAPHQTAWSTTSAARNNPYAVGCSDVTPAQLEALEAEPQVFVFANIDWEREFGTLPGAVRTRLNAFCTEVGVARPGNNEVLRDLLTRMTTILDNKPIEAHVSTVGKQT